MFLSIGEAKLHYRLIGEGRPLLMLHGFGLDHRSMLGFIEPVISRRERWKRVYLDLPGCGRTPPGDVRNADDVLGLVLGFMDTLFPNERFAVAGNSYGGYLARGVVHQRADRVGGLMLLCPTIIPQHKARDLPAKVVLFRDEGFMNALDPKERSDFEAYSVIQTEETWKRHKENIAPGTGSADWAFLSKFQREGYSLSFDPDRLPAPFSKPSLILTGRQDSSVGYRDAWRIVENFPRGTYAVLDRAGHDLESEQLGSFNVLMGEWLDRTEESWGEG